MDTEHLKAFVRIVACGSVQAAARQAGQSRSGLRRSLDALEAEFGTPLLHRDAGGVRVTAAGALLLEQAQQVIDRAQTLVAGVRAAKHDALGVIRVIEPVGLPLAMHLAMILGAHRAMPQLRLEIRHLENPLANLNQPFELMFHEGPAPDRNLWFSRVILRAGLRLVASRDYLERRGTPTRLVDLDEHETLGWNRPGHPGNDLPLLAGGAVLVHPWFTSSDPHLLASLAARGGGLVLVPHMPFFESSETEALVPVLEDQIGQELVFRVTTPFPYQTDPRTRATMQMLFEHLEGLPLD